MTFAAAPRRRRAIPLLALLAWAFASLALAAPPSAPGVDAPELAHLGPYGVGLKRMALVQPRQADLAHLDPATGAATVADRTLPILIWYPAEPAAGAQRATYSGALPPEHASDPPVAFSVEGLAVEGAPPVKGRRFPLVILSHGYSGSPEAVTWIGENLASKGYVVVAIAHRDPPYGDAKAFIGPVLRRPLDDAFVAWRIGALSQAPGELLNGLVDTDRVAVIGYSMGGYGALTEAAGGFDPAGAPAKALPQRYIGPYLPGAPTRDEVQIAGLKAVVAISPFTGQPGAPVLSPQALGAVKTPLLLIAGDQDRVVGFAGVKSVFDQAVHAPRWLLVFREAGHSIGMNPGGPQPTLWGQDWFEDPVWRKQRVIGVSLHFITAFLDRYLKGETDRDAYLLSPVSDADQAAWPAADAGAYGAYSTAQPPVTVWKGFQRVHDAGLRLLHADPAP